ncbi:hypothetical protein KCU61_g51, partial [Aureobasidium melanogenum]
MLQTFPLQRWLENPQSLQLPLPGSGTEVIVARDSLLDVTTGTVQSGRDNGGSPVVGHATAWQHHAEEDDDGAQRKTNIEGGRGDVVVLHPPSAVLLAQVLVEDPTNSAPRKLCLQLAPIFFY